MRIMPETVEKYREYYFDTVKKLLLTPSPSGYYREVMKVVKELAEASSPFPEGTGKEPSVPARTATPSGRW